MDMFLLPNALKEILKSKKKKSSCDILATTPPPRAVFPTFFLFAAPLLSI